MAQPAAPALAPPPARPNCDAAHRRQLDFWVGDWRVFVTGGESQVATSRIERIENGCGIKETYDAPNAPGGAYGGTSYSGYDRNDGHWHQMYIDTNGNVTWYTGDLVGKDMVLFAPGRAGSLQRMTYGLQADGSVTQVGVVSSDGGKTWQPGYNYTYRHR